MSSLADGYVERRGQNSWNEAPALRTVLQRVESERRAEAGAEWIAQGPVRVATLGRSVGPPLFESLEVLGREETLGRLRDALGQARGDAGRPQAAR